MTDVAIILIFAAAWLFVLLRIAKPKTYMSADIATCPDKTVVAICTSNLLEDENGQHAEVVIIDDPLRDDISESKLAEFSEWLKEHQREASFTTVLDRFDVVMQVQAAFSDLRDLEAGWHDGEGIAPSAEGIDWFEGAFLKDENLSPKPYIYPTIDGNVQVEWTIGGWEISMKVDLEKRIGELLAVDTEFGRDIEQTLNLDDPAGWGVLRSTLSIIQNKGDSK